MEYTIKEASEKTNLSIYTLRYYDKMGLLPLLQRSNSGVRKFSENDISWINLICCLKNSGMSIENLQKFTKSCLLADEACEQRKEILLEHKDNILAQMEQLQHSLKTIDYKLAHYKEIGLFHLDSSCR